MKIAEHCARDFSHGNGKKVLYMKTLRNNPLLLATACLLAAAGFGPVASATPYASGVSNVSGTVSFFLNESADAVMIVTNSPAGVTGTNNQGALAKGLHSFSLGSATNYQIVVSKNSLPGYRTQTGVTTNGYYVTNVPTACVLQISDNTNPRLTFNSPRGIAINKRANSPYFGRVYVANSDPGTATSLGGVTRTAGDGIYVMNGDLGDALGQGDTAKTAGLSSIFALSSESPYRLTLGLDDMLYICDKAVPGSENLYMTDANVSNGSGTNIFEAFIGTTQFPVGSGSGNNHGRIESAAIIGSLAAGTFRAMWQDQDLAQNLDDTNPSTRNSIWRTGLNLGWGNIPITSAVSWGGNATWQPPSATQQGTGGFISDFEMLGR